MVSISTHSLIIDSPVTSPLLKMSSSVARWCIFGSLHDIKCLLRSELHHLFAYVVVKGTAWEWFFGETAQDSLGVPVVQTVEDDAKVVGLKA